MTQRDDRVTELAERLTVGEARHTRDEARHEVDQQEARENRSLAWLGIGLGVVIAVALGVLVISQLALKDDVGTISRRSAPDATVSTAALRDASVTFEKLATGAVGRGSIAGGAVGPAELAPDAVAGANVAPDSLTGDDIHERTLGTVPAARKANNAANLGGRPARVYLSRVVTVRTASPADTLRTKGPMTARCPSGSRVVSGGATIEGSTRGAAIVSSAPDGGAGWSATARVARSPNPVWRLVVAAICAKGGD